MNPRQFEEYVANYYSARGYTTELTQYSGDCGVDVFAKKKGEKLAIQVKMYGDSRKVNKQCVFELHGAKDYFDCTKAVIATDGSILADANEAAKKLGIEILKIDGIPTAALKKTSSRARKDNIPSFADIYEQYIIPLKGKTIYRTNGESNQILDVDWSGIKRITSSGKTGVIKIEILKLTIERLLAKGEITRDEINQEYIGRAASGIILLLSQVPHFSVKQNPVRLVLTSDISQH